MTGAGIGARAKDCHRVVVPGYPPRVLTVLPGNMAGAGTGDEMAVTLDVPLDQIAIHVPWSPKCWHHRLLLAPVGSDTVWIAATPDRTLEVLDLSLHKVVPLPRGVRLPWRTRRSILPSSPLTNEELDNLLDRSLLLAASLTAGTTAAYPRVWPEGTINAVSEYLGQAVDPTVPIPTRLIGGVVGDHTGTVEEPRQPSQSPSSASGAWTSPDVVAEGASGRQRDAFRVNAALR